MKPIGETLAELRKQAQYSQIDAAAMLTKEGYPIKNKGISAWEKGLSTPNAPQFLLLCKMYGITDIYSAFLEPNPENPLAVLNEEGKEKAQEFINILALTDKFKYVDTSNSNNTTVKEETIVPFRTRELPLFLLPASAGPGEFLDSDAYDMVVVGSEVPESASFGIRLNGDSMTPRYLDGQIVWVHKTSELVNGDIGIFYLDGNAYCKRLHREDDLMELISINPEYAPIPITENNDFRIYGRVVS